MKDFDIIIKIGISALDKSDAERRTSIGLFII